MEIHKLLIQMSGAPGSGKSMLANLLAQHSSINAVVINHDLVKSFFLDNGITFQRSAELTYGLQWVLAGDLLRQVSKCTPGWDFYSVSILTNGTSCLAGYTSLEPPVVVLTRERRKLLKRTKCMCR